MSVLDQVHLTKTIGTEIRGIKLADIDDDVAKQIQQLVAERCVLVFRDQPMTVEEQYHVGTRLGEVTGGTGQEGSPGRANGPGNAIKTLHTDSNSVNTTGEGWHSDRSLDQRPPALTMLRIETVPSAGGDTAFSSMYHAYESLSPPLQEFLLGLTAVFTKDRYERFRAQHTRGGVFKSKSELNEVQEHPLVRTHPLTGRRALYVSEMYTERIKELGPHESDALLRFLYGHIARGVPFQLRVKWEPNTVTIWDNRCAQHYAIWDYFPETRHGYRLTTVGEKPFQQ